MKVKVTDNVELANQIRAKLKERNGLCPCKLVDAPENYCMCMEFLNQKSGECHCGLYMANVIVVYILKLRNKESVHYV